MPTNEQADAKARIDERIGGARSLIRSLGRKLSGEQVKALETSISQLLLEVRKIRVAQKSEIGIIAIEK